MEMLNLLVREPGESDKVFTECAGCHELVARYTIAPRGYFHHGKGVESYLRGLNRGGAYESAKEVKDGFTKMGEACLAEFKKVKEEEAKMSR
jgi:hypothetical protein